jgi:hypothetical protein
LGIYQAKEALTISRKYGVKVIFLMDGGPPARGGGKT